MENIAEKDRERDCKGGCRMDSPGVLFMPQVPRWGIQEVAVYGPQEGNPFTEHRIRGCFQGKNETVEAEGFYDGEGRYLVRFMPSFEGEYRFEIRADFLEEEERGSFRALPAEAGNHGPVRVANTWHFAFEDGTPYYPVGTTCYVWELQDDARIEETLNSLKEAGFNKIRFCVFPKHYDYNLKEPRSYPYEGTPMDSSVLTKENFWEYTGKTEGNHWDFTRFNPAHFQHIEKCIAALGKLGIEASWGELEARPFSALHPGGNARLRPGSPASGMGRGLLRAADGGGKCSVQLLSVLLQLYAAFLSGFLF